MSCVRCGVEHGAMRDYVCGECATRKRVAGVLIRHHGITVDRARSMTALELAQLNGIGRKSIRWLHSKDWPYPTEKDFA